MGKRFVSVLPRGLEDSSSGVRWVWDAKKETGERLACRNGPVVNILMLNVSKVSFQGKDSFTGIFQRQNVAASASWTLPSPATSRVVKGVNACALVRHENAWQNPLFCHHHHQSSGSASTKVARERYTRRCLNSRRLGDTQRSCYRSHIK